jgi:excisionase family DNA binding protein
VDALLLKEVTTVLTEVGRKDLAERLAKELHVEESRADELLTSGEVARLLGVSSPNTVKNWLEGGHFPGAFRTQGGHWRFPRAEVLEVARRRDELAQRNQHGELTLPEEQDDGEPPLL